MSLTILLVASVSINIVTSARILGIVTTPAYSHQETFQPIWRELSVRGHQVTVLTTHPIQDPTLTNLTEIDLSGAREKWTQQQMEIVEKLDKPMEMFTLSLNSLVTAIEYQLKHPAVQNLIRNEHEHFDVVMMEFSIPIMAAFAERFKCPLIAIMSIDGTSGMYHMMGNPVHPVLYPASYLGFVGELTLIEKITSIVIENTLNTFIRFFIWPAEDKRIKKYFGEGYPSVFQILGKSVSMIFFNTDPIFHSIRPLVPAIVQIGGGIHLRAPKALPKDLQNTLDEATQGFIYFSLGSSIKCKYIPEETRNVLLQTFAELPYLILWKFELEELSGKPSNVIISKWFPQQDILRHPNIKLFITQGGLQSMEEGIYSHVPMVGIPFFFDQPGNVKRLVWKGMGLQLDYKTLEKENAKATITEVITNPIYRNKIKHLATLARDEPMTGLERAVWWTEYVIRHKGARHLRSPALDLPLYQYYLLDIIGIFLFVILVVSYVCYKLCVIVKLALKSTVTKIKLKTT